MNDSLPEKPFLAELSGRKQQSVPFWLMRQAGRYLPEYRKLRESSGGFLSMVYDADTASEITLQPIRRFGMDAAIIFSDILVVPQALGQALEFTEGEGPKLDPLTGPESVAALKSEIAEATLVKVYGAIAGTKGKLAAEGFDTTALIGFAGAPWTLACYMIEGGGSKDFQKARAWAYRDPQSFGALIDTLTEITAEYLIGQIRAGAEAVQLFDSWAGVLEANQFHRWVIQPAKKIVEAVRREYPDVPLIGFPRGAGILYRDYARDTGITAIACDQGVPTAWAASALQNLCTVQGNLDPVALLTGGDPLRLAVEKILEALGQGPFVFNLGHGVIKETPLENVEHLARLLREFAR